MLLKIISIFI